MLNSIDNTNVNFTGKLINHARFRFDRAKFAEVAKIYEEKTAGLPDLHIYPSVESVNICYPKQYYIQEKNLIFDSPAAFFQSWYAEFKPWFEKHSSGYIADVLARITKTSDKSEKLSIAVREKESLIKSLERKINFHKFIAETRNDKFSKAHDSMAKLIQAKLDNIKAELGTLKDKKTKLKFPEEMNFGGVFQ